MIDERPASREEERQRRQAFYLANVERRAQAAEGVNSRATDEAFENIHRVKDPGAMQALGLWLRNPRAIGYTVSQSAGMGVQQLALTAATGGMSRLVTAGVSGAGSTSIEYGATMQEVMAEEGVDLANGADVRRALADPELMERARKKAATRGLIIGAFDAVFAGMAGNFIRNARQGMRSAAWRVAADQGNQMLGGGLGEAAAQLATEGQLDWVEVWGEALGEAAFGATEIHANYRTARNNGELLRQKQELDRLTGSAAGARQLGELTDAAHAVTMGQSSPQAFAAAMVELAPDGHVYLALDQARTLFQSEADGADAFIAELTGNPDAASDAAVSGGDIAIPVAEYLSKLATRADADAVAQHVRLASDHLSRAELEDTAKLDEFITNFIGDTSEAAERATPEQQEAAQRVEEDVAGQLIATGRYRQSDAKLQAKLWGRFFGILAQKTGQDAFALYQRRMGRIRSEQGAAHRKPKTVDARTDALLTMIRTNTIPGGKEAFGTSLVQWLVDNGGVREDGGELGAMDASKVRPGLVNNMLGMTLDEAREKAVEAGYLRDIGAEQDGVTTSGIDELLNAIRDELGGTPTYSEANANAEAVATRDAALDLQRQMDDNERIRGLTNEQFEALSNQELYDLLNPSAWQRMKDGAKRLFQGKPKPKGELDALRASMKPIGQKLLDRWIADPDTLIAEYAALTDKHGNNETDGGRKIDADLVRELSPEYRANRQLSQDVHPAVSYIAKQMQSRLLAGPVAEGRDNAVFVLGGGGGSGKSTVAASISHNPDISIDGTLSDYNKAKQLIEQIRASGREVRIMFVRTDPEKAYGFAVKRANKPNARTVPNWALAEAHANAPSVVKRLAQEYDGAQGVSIRIYDNSGAAGEHYRIAAESIPEVANATELQQRFDEIARDKLASGEIDQALYNALTAPKATPIGGGGNRALGTQSQRGLPQKPTSESGNTLTQDPAAGGVSVSDGSRVLNQSRGDYVVHHTAPGASFGATADDLTGMFPADYYSPNGWRYYGTGYAEMDRKAHKLMIALRGRPDAMVTIYRAVPSEFAESTINEGDWVTILREYAQEHGESVLDGDFTIIEKQVPASTIYNNADSILEWGYDPNQLFQSSDSSQSKSPRGQLRIAPDGTMSIDLFKSADMSTFLHESAHFFLEVMQDVAQDSPEVAADLKVLLEWAGHTGDGPISTEAHEKVARGFEAYLRDGKAPAPELRGMFARFRAWLVDIYKAVTQLNVELSDEVRGVFDRMLATDAEIEMAQVQQEARGPMDLSDEARSMLTGKQWEAYVAMTEAATEEARAEVFAKTMKAWKREQSRWWKQELSAMREQVAAEYNEQPAVRAWRVLSGKAGKQVKSHRIKPVALELEGWTGSASELSALARSVFTDELQGTSELNQSLEQHVAFTSEGKGEAFGSRGKLRSPIRAELVKVLRELVAQAVHIQENAPTKGREKDSKAFHVMLVPLRVNDQTHAVKLTVREALKVPEGGEPFKFYDVTSLEIQESPGVRGVDAGASRPAPAEAFAPTVGQLAAAFNLDVTVDGGHLPPPLRSLKLDKQPLLDRYGKEWLKDNLLRLRVYATEGGTHPETAAAMLGFDSADALVQALASVKDLQARVDAEAEARMVERHGDPMTDGSLPEEAMKAVHNNARVRVLEQELALLAQLAGQPAPPMRMIREWAKRKLGETQVKAVRPDDYLQAERKAAREAAKAAARGDYAQALQAKRQQATSAAMYSEAMKVKDKLAKRANAFKKAGKRRTRELVGKRAGKTYVDALDALLDTYGLAGRSASQQVNRTALRQWVANMQADGLDTNISEDVLAAVESGNITQPNTLTVNGLEEVHEAIQNLLHHAREEDKIRTADGVMTWEEAKSRMVEQLKTLESKPLEGLSDADRALLQCLGELAEAGANWVLHPETAIEWLDAGEKGVFHDVLWNQGEQAEAKRNQLKRMVGEKLKAALDALPADQRKALDNKHRIESLDMSVSGHTIISALLNMGTESNRDKLLRGGMVRGDDVVTFTEPQLAEMFSKLTRAQAETVQGIWDATGSLWPEIVAMQEATAGFAPPKVEAMPVTVMTADGAVTLRGGYFPLAYDPRGSRAGAVAEKDMEAKQAAGIAPVKATTSKGHLEARTDFAGPLLLDWHTVLSRHLDGVMSDIAYRQVLRQAQKVLGDPEIRRMIDNRIGTNAHKILLASFERGAVGSFALLPLFGPWQGVANAALTNVTSAALGYRATLALANVVTVPFLAAARMRYSDLARGFAMYYGGGISGMKRHTAAIHALSPLMQRRAEARSVEFGALMDGLRNKRGFRKQMIELGMSMQQWTVHLAENAAWLGQYHARVRAGDGPAAAAMSADKMIRQTQMKSASKDLSMAEGNPYLRAAMMFAGPLVIINNRMQESGLRGLRGVVKTPSQALGVWFVADEGDGANLIYTGGNHGSDGSSGGLETARMVEWQCWVDGVLVPDGAVLSQRGREVTVRWVNELMASNTISLNRYALRQSVVARFTAGHVAVAIEHEALEPITVRTDNGLQMRADAYELSVHFYGGEAKRRQAAANVNNSGAKVSAPNAWATSALGSYGTQTSWIDLGIGMGRGEGVAASSPLQRKHANSWKFYQAIVAGVHWRMQAGDSYQYRGSYGWTAPNFVEGDVDSAFMFTKGARQFVGWAFNGNSEHSGRILLPPEFAGAQAGTTLVGPSGLPVSSNGYATASEEIT